MYVEEGGGALHLAGIHHGLCDLAPRLVRQLPQHPVVLLIYTVLGIEQACTDNGTQTARHRVVWTRGALTPFGVRACMHAQTSIVCMQKVPPPPPTCPHGTSHYIIRF